MTIKPRDPPVPEFASAEEAASYQRWFRAKVQASLDDSRPYVEHQQVMAEMDSLIAQLEARPKRG